ncbi:6-bladed beta-propeller [Rhodocaloribacter litoris]|uniref:6-bladed beta-propeller n=1 Tax=Rhodocaloribacter litoris TaxID=2558931 RepID=UPI00141D8607|nr:6-bladed beta-propeller [Rhodocaloribacter litoris]QXD16777.1 6-bladed beta-propeller [Rhodocaloribacter litoris]
MTIGRSALLSVLLLAGCRAETSTRSPDVAPPDTLVPEPLFRLGEEEDDLIFGYIAGALLDGQGRLLVADWDAGTIHVFEADGRPAGQIGQKGEGPGEFQMISSLTLGPNDSLYVHDRALRRISVFDSEGAFVRSITVQAEGRTVPGDLLGAVPEGLLVRYAHVFTPRDDQQSKSLTFVHLIGYDGTRRPDTLLVSPDIERIVLREGGSIHVRTKPFGRGARIQAEPGGALWYGWTERLALERIDWRTGTRRTVITYDLPPQPVSRAERDSLLRDEDLVRMLNATGVSLPEYKPAFSTFVLGPGGTVWVRLTPEHGAGTVPWLVFNAEGAVRAAVRLPVNVWIQDIGADRIVGADRTRAQVVVYRLPEALRGAA